MEVDVLLLINKLDIILRQKSDDVLLDYNLTGRQSSILRYIHTNDEKEICLKDIENNFSISKATASGIVSRLEKNEFICIKSKNNDSRYKIIKCSNMTKELSLTFDKLRIKTLKSIESLFDKDEYKLLLEYIERIVKNVLEPKRL